MYTCYTRTGLYLYSDRGGPDPFSKVLYTLVVSDGGASALDGGASTL